MFEMSGNKVTLAPCEAGANENLFVNGNQVDQKLTLKHQDRILIGTNSVFLINIPGQENDRNPLPEGVTEIDYDLAVQEKAEKEGGGARMKELEEQLAKEREEAEKRRKEQEAEFEKKMKELQNS